ncbi:hypothetical protein BB559_004623 [Furculomyces boomerangus]|uniref:RRM domain-containing protein n=1 Tax=Furculomyces boomerangus TaxID=61424 RepID=A0A2T9YDK3_9FUNG|nr:hypothetical protein BB559_004623 [Furculomyces boomerangus]
MDIDQESIKRKGRGFKPEKDDEPGRIHIKGASKDSPEKSVEGWVILVTGLHEECKEEDMFDRFGEYGEIKNLHLNLDRQTGFVKGYALVEYDLLKSAENAIKGENGNKLLGKEITVGFAFLQQKDDRERRGHASRSKSPRR